MPIIKVDGLAKTYGTVQALKGISFEVNSGEIIGLLGPNGAGKTTTMKILSGYLQPTQGSATVAGHDVVEAPLRVQEALGYLPENAPLYEDMSVQDYLTLMADLRQLAPGQKRQLMSEAIYSTGLEARLTQYIGNLSKGFRQRVCLAQAILHKPKVLILDEPTNGLDPNQIIEIRSLIRRLAEHATVLVSTHILSEVEATCHRAIIIMEGEIRADAQLSELTSSNDAVLMVQRGPDGIQEKLERVDGVVGVKEEEVDNGYRRFRVSGKVDLVLCPLIYDVARQNDWRLAELRQDARTLESVFRELAERGGIAA